MSIYRLFILGCFFIAISISVVSAQDKNRRNLSWTIEGNNDPILQVKNESEEPVTVEIRLILDDESFRYSPDLEVPVGESRFLRVREVLERLSRRYEELLKVSSGVLQVQFVGDAQQIETAIVNLNPKMGVTSGKASQPNPVIRSIEPSTGSPAGGTAVTIVGENFNEATTVKFGGVPALRNLQSADVLIAVAPPHSAGTVDVEVSNGKIRSGLRNAFTYAADQPVILQVEPGTGPVSGGGGVKIRGRNFQSGARVLWDRRPLAARFVSPEELLITVPAGPRGPIGIEVINPTGSHAILENAFQYTGAPRVVSVQPRMGSPEGGYTITINGEHFDPGCSVLFGGNYGETTYINPRTLAAVVPRSTESGPIDVSVSTEDGEIDTLPDGFLYNQSPVILSVTAVHNPIVRNTTTIITVEATDPEAGELDYRYRLAQGPGSVSGQGGRTAVYNSPNVIGIAVIQVTVYDEHGASAQRNLEIRVE